MKLVGQDLYRHSNFITFNLLEMSTGVINIMRLFSPMIGVEVSIICVCVCMCAHAGAGVFILKKLLPILFVFSSGFYAPVFSVVELLCLM